LTGCQVLAELLRGELLELRDRVDRHVLQAFGALRVQAELAVARVQDEGSRGEPEGKSVQGEGHHALLEFESGCGPNLPTSSSPTRAGATCALSGRSRAAPARTVPARAPVRAVRLTTLRRHRRPRRRPPSRRR